MQDRWSSEENPWAASQEPNPWRTTGTGSRHGTRVGAALIAASPIERAPLPSPPVRWTIYCHTHAATGRRYVGQTIKTMAERWTAHKRKAEAERHPLLSEAVYALGPRAFTHEVLEVVRTQAEANAAEQRWIAHFGCQAPHGFNQTVGGERHHENRPETPKRRPATGCHACLKGCIPGPYHRRLCPKWARASAILPRARP